MNNFIEFYKGNSKNIDGKTIYELLSLSDTALEKSHNVVQWLYPIDEPSKHYRRAPVLDFDTIQTMTESHECRHNLKDAYHRFDRFLRQNDATKPTWITPKNHNYLRITRVIRCYKLVEMHDIAEHFYNLAMDYDKDYHSDIGDEVVGFWKRAING